MRLNMPVTHNEYVLNEGMTIVSTTDLQGNINYANPYFIEVSGFSREELIGAPQNILRHPDMPAEAFADMWATIKAGRPWSGMVKNRCKNGDYYWVLANVTPVVENGRPIGYMSVRTKPGREQIRQADELYKNFKSGNPRHLRFANGRVHHLGLASTVAVLRRLSLDQHIGLNTVFQALLLLLVLAVWRVDGGSSGAAAFAALASLYFWASLHGTVVAPPAPSAASAPRLLV